MLLQKIFLMNKTIKPDFSDNRTLEKFSSAYTLSDMEIFIFPELFYPLVIADIMSPIIWKWRDDPWFRDIHKKNFISRSNRIKQYIIDNYIFNLDLETWGLTDKARETSRFSDFFDTDILKNSNALFGYEGDKYYFSIDIRKHFGLDKYDSSVIPYWKTETVEAMTAFRYKENFSTGAGECVSLAALYAAAMFIVGGVPLEKIFMMATPLHSQNFISEKEGLLTNNRRIMTKNMWFNGTSLSAKARRALENEKVTIVSHITGHIHTVYDKATIDSRCYLDFTEKLKDFVKSPLTAAVLINFLRFKPEYKCLFQYRYDRSGSSKYIALDKIFEYEHSSKFSFNEETRDKLLSEIEGEEFWAEPIEEKILLNDIELFLKENNNSDLETLKRQFFLRFNPVHVECAGRMFSDIEPFIITIPRLPSAKKDFVSESYPHITTSDTREDIIEKVKESAYFSEMSLLSLYAFRDMETADWRPFIKAAVERNPVCHSFFTGKRPREIYDDIEQLQNESVYDAGRLAQPDEVWNFRRGDGIEKAFLMADALRHQDKTGIVLIDIDNEIVTLSYKEEEFGFRSVKQHKKKIEIRPEAIKVR